MMSKINRIIVNNLFQKIRITDIIIILVIMAKIRVLCVRKLLLIKDHTILRKTSRNNL